MNTTTFPRIRGARPWPLLLAAAALVALAGCNGDDIGALPEAIDPGTPVGGITVPPPPGSVVLDAVDRGWWTGAGAHMASNKNTLTISINLGATDYNSFFVFDLSGVASPFSGAELLLEVTGYPGPDPFETVSVWDVTTPIATLTADGPTGGVHPDLETGVNYGAFNVTLADVGTIVSVPLNGAAVADVTAALGGAFAVGLSIDTDGGSGLQEGAQFSAGNEARTHQLVLIP